MVLHFILALAIVAAFVLSFVFGVMAKMPSSTNAVVEWTFSVSGWLAVILLFVPVRVWRTCSSPCPNRRTRRERIDSEAVVMIDRMLPRQVDDAYRGHKLALWLFGAQAFVSIFAAWRLAQATMGLLSVVVLVRYRALVPFLFALLLLEHLCRKAIFAVMPIDRTAGAPATSSTSRWLA